MKVKDKFYINSLIMTFSNIITGILGFVFTIILSKKLGTEGLGLYGLIMPVYGLMLCLTSEGLITALSKISTIYSSKKDFKNLNRTFETVVVFITIWSSTIALLFFINSGIISLHIVNDPRVIDAMRIICPALLFAPVSALLKGYFYGRDKFNIPALIDIIEKIFRVTVLLSLSFLLSQHDIKNTVTFAYLALAFGEFVSFTLLSLFYIYYRKKTKSMAHKSRSRIQLLVDSLVISTPICLTGVVSSVISTVSTLILPRRLMIAGFAYHSALSVVGEFTGMALNITFLPLIIISSMMIVLIPDLSLSVSKKDFWSAEQRIAQVMRLSSLVGIAMLVITLTIPDLLGHLFYNRPHIGNMIKFASIASFISYVAAPTYTILNSLGKQNSNLRISILVSVEGLVLIYFLVGLPSLNIYGYGIALIITSLTTLFLNVYEIRKVCDIRVYPKELLSFVLIGLISFFILKPIEKSIINIPLTANVGVIAILGSIMVYFLFRLFNKLLLADSKNNF